jgi:hypothetical protein
VAVSARLVADPKSFAHKRRPGTEQYPLPPGRRSPIALAQNFVDMLLLVSCDLVGVIREIEMMSPEKLKVSVRQAITG